MDEESKIDELRAELSSAVRESVTTLAAESKLSGAALCTDDDMQTVFLVACSYDDCASADDPDFRFLPVEWELEPDGKLWVLKRYGPLCTSAKHFGQEGAFVKRQFMVLA